MVFSCTECGGRGCEVCGDRGTWTPTDCPARYLGDGAVWGIMALADLARRGSWPLTGGTLDQTRWFLEFCSYLWSEQDVIEAKLGITRR